MNGYIKYFENGGKNISLLISIYLKIVRYGRNMKTFGMQLKIS